MAVAVSNSQPEAVQGEGAPAHRSSSFCRSTRRRGPGFRQYGGGVNQAFALGRRGM